VKIIVDMNMSVEWIEYLRDRGHDAEHWSRLGPSDAKDEDIMEYCLQNHAVILSGDLDFAKLHAFAGSVLPSVIQLRSPDMLPESIGQYVARALSVAAQNLEDGAVATVTPPRVRITKLPIGRWDPA
jgi:predicted nuclease of predicted toxin-antitoxin system